jgi:transposase InsO family protein
MVGREDLPMPWKATCAMDERMRFVIAAGEEGAVMTDVCEHYAVSRTTGYKWLARYRRDGVEGLKDRSRAPLQHGRARPEGVFEAVLGLRERYRHWGPRKLRAKLAELQPDLDVPAASTIGDWLCREGLTHRQARRRRSPPSTQPFAAVTAANDVWGVDFKGWFCTGDGARCDPLTITDAFSRSLLRCRGVIRPDHEQVRPIFEAAFAEFGLPKAIRSDNGAPFASTGAGGLSALALWWIKLGIAPERIKPGKPQQNGRHERMHRTLKAEAASPPAATLKEQQERFDRFRREFNEERPHEALGQKTPASFYVASSRPYPCALREPVYDQAAAVRKVRSSGEIKWNGEFVFVSQVLIGEPVGIAETESGEWRVTYAHVELGFIDPKRNRLYRRPPAASSSPACGNVDNAEEALPTVPQAQQQQQTPPT